MKKVKNKIGPPVEGDNFYGREKELAYVWRRLEDNNAIKLDNCYQALLDQSHLNTWIERIKEQYGDLEGDTFALLKNLCQSKKGEKRDNLLNILAARHANDFGRAEDQLNTLLYMLKNDGYIDDTEGAYYFRSPLIRDFWYRRFVK